MHLARLQLTRFKRTHSSYYAIFFRVPDVLKLLGTICLKSILCCKPSQNTLLLKHNFAVQLNVYETLSTNIYHSNKYTQMHY